MKKSAIGMLVFLNACLCFSHLYGQKALSKGEHFAPVNGIKLHYYVTGEGPVCLLPSPGWGPSVDLYKNSLTPFEKYFTMVYYDTRISGKSTGPEDSTKYTCLDFINDLDSLRVYLKLNKVWVMGHSAGGLQVLNYGIHHNENLYGIIAIDALAGIDSLKRSQMKNIIMKRQGQPYFEKGSQLLLSDTASFTADEILVVLPFYFHDQHNIDTLMKFDTSPMSAKANKYTSISQFGSEYLFPDLNKINVPTLVIVGDDDFICDKVSQADRIAKMVNFSTEIVIKNAGHFPWLEQPAEFYGKCKEWFREQKLKEHK